MVLLSAPPPPGKVLRQLRAWQEEVDSLGNYPEKVAAAKSKFAARNVPANVTFRLVKESLTTMCAGARRCGYCEDSAADEIEHIRPKDLYPEQVFSWENYLYACGPCNGPKGSRYSIFSRANGRLVQVARTKDAEIVPPEPGEHVLIDPRVEDPLEFLWLDLLGTFWFLPRSGISPRARERAAFTIEVLRLNERDLLPQARDEAYRSYRARLREYVEDRDRGKSQDHLTDLVRAITRMQHPTVWEEMKRQSPRIPGLSELFDRAPESLNW